MKNILLGKSDELALMPPKSVSLDGEIHREIALGGPKMQMILCTIGTHYGFHVLLTPILNGNVADHFHVLCCC